jgi:CRP-like cAMP-binding protein
MNNACPVCGPDFVRWLNAEPLRQAAWLAFPRRWLDAGEVLQSVGQSQSAVWFVELGLLRSHFLNAEGRERNCAFHPEWHWAGMPPPRSEPVVATVAIEAIERSHVVELSHAALAEWLTHRPEMQGTLTEALVVNLMAASRRESGLLMDSAEARYMQFLAEHPAIAERVALHHVASYLGITNVALSRVRRRMKDRKTASAQPEHTKTRVD